MESTTEEDFDRRYLQLRDELLLSTHSGDNRFAQYLANMWHPDRAQYASYALDTCMHLGQVWTSRLEGQHHHFKSALRTCLGDVFQVVKTFIKFSDDQLKKIREAYAQLARIRSSKCPPLMRYLQNNITKTAWKMIWSSHEKALDALEGRGPLPECTSYQRQVNGLPCAHDILERLQAANPVPFEEENVHRHWHVRARYKFFRGKRTSRKIRLRPQQSLLLRQEPIQSARSLLTASCAAGQLDTDLLLSSFVTDQALLHPRRIRTRGRPRGTGRSQTALAGNDPGPESSEDDDSDIFGSDSGHDSEDGTSCWEGRPSINWRPNGLTACDLTMAEIVLAPAAPIRRCRLCGQTGHNARTCPTLQVGPVPPSPAAQYRTSAVPSVTSTIPVAMLVQAK